MKKSPDMEKLEAMLRSSKLSSNGFLGDDDRSLDEIVNADIAVVKHAGRTVEEIAERMRDITLTAIKGLGMWVEIDSRWRAMVFEAKGVIVCPWPHAGRYYKRLTQVELLDKCEMICWSDLNIHLIGEHGFFEGKGSDWRIEPDELMSIIFQ